MGVVANKQLIHTNVYKQIVMGTFYLNAAPDSFFI